MAVSTLSGLNDKHSLTFTEDSHKMSRLLIADVRMDVKLSLWRHAGYNVSLRVSQCAEPHIVCFSAH